MINISEPCFDELEEKAILEVLRSGHVASGPKVAEFEAKFALYLGVKFSSALSSGTAALHLACLALGVGEGDEVITTPFSFIASSNAAVYCGAKPVFVDIEEKSFNLDPDLIEGVITPRTKAILVVHLYGRPADMKKILGIAKKHNLKVIEDACQAHGASIDGKKVGTWGDVGCFSFYATKNMTTVEGGMVVSDDKELIEKINSLRNHGSRVRYVHEDLGFNFRLTDLNAAIGLVQLKKLDDFNQKRRQNATYLNKQLRGLENISLPTLSEGMVVHQYSVILDETLDREKVRESMLEAGVGTGVFYPIPIHKQKRYLESNPGLSLKVSERMSKKVLSLPIHPKLSTKDLDQVASVLKRSLGS